MIPGNECLALDGEIGTLYVGAGKIETRLTPALRTMAAITGPTSPLILSLTDPQRHCPVRIIS
jgi:hypothetical protein